MEQPTALFFARVRNLNLLRLLEFYREDMQMLESLGYTVRVETSMWRGMASRADVCLAWWWPSALPVVTSFRLRHRPVVVTGSVWEDSNATAGALWRRLLIRLRRSLTRASLRLADGNLAISECEAKLLNRYPNRGVACLYPGVDTEFYDVRPKAPTPTIVTVGQLNPESIKRKGIDRTVLAMRTVLQEVPDARLLLIGPGNAGGVAQVRQLCGRVGRDAVQLLGERSREEKRDLVASAWLYCQPSVFEGFGLAVAEAMASGTVPVVSRNGALPEVVGDGGVVLPERDSESVARVLIGLLRDPDQRTDLAARARRRAVEAFDSRDRQARAATVLAVWFRMDGRGPTPAAARGGDAARREAAPEPGETARRGS